VSSYSAKSWYHPEDGRAQCFHNAGTLGRHNTTSLPERQNIFLKQTLERQGTITQKLLHQALLLRPPTA
jgi:hypothetical protein